MWVKRCLCIVVPVLLFLAGAAEVRASSEAPIIENLDGDAVPFVVGGAAVNIDAGRDAVAGEVYAGTLDEGFLEINYSGKTFKNGNFAVDGENVTSGGDGALAGGGNCAGRRGRHGYGCCCGRPVGQKPVY